MSAGTSRPITRYGAAVLHRPCAPVDSFDTALQVMGEDMSPSMYAAKGVRPAANRLDAGLRMFVYDCSDASSENQAGLVVNPDAGGTPGLPAAGHRFRGVPVGARLAGGGNRATAVTVTGTGVHGSPLTVTATVGLRSAR